MSTPPSPPDPGNSFKLSPCPPVAPVAQGEAPLKLRRVAIDTYRENVAYLHRDCERYRAKGFQALSKVEVRANGRMVLATLNVTHDPRIVKCDEIGLSIDAFAQLGVDPGHPATISQAKAPVSIAALHRKISGARLGREEFRASSSVTPTSAAATATASRATSLTPAARWRRCTP